jgi:hypothetical protein
MSSRQLRANRQNAAASTGPRTKAGKARSAQNAFRHGLNIPVWSDPTLAPQAEAIARKIADPEVNAEALEWARQIGEAQVDLNRVRSLRRDAITRMLADPLGGLSIGVAQVRILDRFLSRVERDRVRPADIETIDDLLRPKHLEGDTKLAVILADRRGELARLDRYERRALSRRKNAIRAYEVACSINEVRSK